MEEQKTYINIDNFRPSECISGKVRRCNRIVANVFRKHLSQFNITDSQLSIVFIVSKVKDSNQKKISEILCLEKSTVNRNLTRLLKNNIISYDDSKNLNLTEEGKQQLIQILPHWENAMIEIRSILNEEGEDAINLLIQKLSN